MVAASAAVAEINIVAPAPDATIPADSATADTAFKNLEPAFISPITFFLVPITRRPPIPVTCVVLPAFDIQAREQVNFCLLHFKACRFRHYSFETS
jgi:hypothetical protein